MFKKLSIFTLTLAGLGSVLIYSFLCMQDAQIKAQLRADADEQFYAEQTDLRHNLVTEETAQTPAMESVEPSASGSTPQTVQRDISRASGNPATAAQSESAPEPQPEQRIPFVFNAVTDGDPSKIMVNGQPVVPPAPEE